MRKKISEDRLHHASREADSSSAPIADAKISESGRSHMINTGLIRDGNLDTDTWPDGYKYKDDFLLVGDTRTWPKSRRVCDGYFFPPADKPMGTRYFTISIILGCE
jgi:hypothetical protein